MTSLQKSTSPDLIHRAALAYCHWMVTDREISQILTAGRLAVSAGKAKLLCVYFAGALKRILAEKNIELGICRTKKQISQGVGVGGHGVTALPKFGQALEKEQRDKSIAEQLAQRKEMELAKLASREEYLSQVLDGTYTPLSGPQIPRPKPTHDDADRMENELADIRRRLQQIKGVQSGQVQNSKCKVQSGDVGHGVTALPVTDLRQPGATTKEAVVPAEDVAELSGRVAGSVVSGPVTYDISPWLTKHPVKSVEEYEAERERSIKENEARRLKEAVKVLQKAKAKVRRLSKP